jgi:hypothetical protein
MNTDVLPPAADLGEQRTTPVRESARPVGEGRAHPGAPAAMTYLQERV